MKIAIHDFGGYAFPVQLARQMAQDGHPVEYLYSDFYAIKGAVGKRTGDPAGFNSHCVSIGQKHARYSFGKRAVQEIKYGRALVKRLAGTRPECVASCNTPILTAWILARWCHRNRVGYVHWAQDLHSVAVRSILQNKNRLLGACFGPLADWMERDLMQKAGAVVVISEDFLKEIEKLGARLKAVFIIPNWMPLDEMSPGPRNNPWAQRHGLVETLNLMYVGTLSLKHDIMPFVHLAEHFHTNNSVRIVVVAFGSGFDELGAIKKARELQNLVLLGAQPYNEIANVFATGDVHFATIAPESSAFSVPCKILSYASAGRPVLAAMPGQNLVSKLVVQNDFGEVVEAGNIPALLQAANRLLFDSQRQGQCAANGRAFAEREFDVRSKAKAFYRVFEKAISSRFEE